MDPTAFLALAERCAPTTDHHLLAALVRRASGYEPLARISHSGEVHRGSE